MQDSGAGDELKNSALLALARIGELEGSELDDSAMVRLFVEHLAHEHSGVAENACVALGVLGHASGVPVLAAIANDTDEGRKICGRTSIPTYLRAFAAYGLGLIGERSSIVDVRRYAANELMLALEDDARRNDVRVACVIGLGLVDVDDSNVVTELLLELFEDKREDDAVRAHAATSMARHLAATSDELRAKVTKELIRATHDRSKEPNAVRQSCVIALGLVGDADEDAADERIRAALMKAVGGKDQMSRSFAVMSLAEVGARAGEGEGDPYAGSGEIRAFLLKNLARGKSATKPWTALALGVLGRELAFDGVNLPAADVIALRMTLEDEKSPHELAALGLGAGLCGDVDATEYLVERLGKTGDRELISHIAVALGLTGSREAIEPLHVTLRDAKHDLEMMRETAIALVLLHDSDLVPELLALLDECECSQSQSAVASALGHTGDARVVSPLVEMLSDDTRPERTRTWAAHALGLVADKEALPWSSRISVDLNYRANPSSLTSPDRSGIIDFP